VKILKAISFVAFALAINASAATYYVVGTCGSFSNGFPNPTTSGTWVCPTADSLGVNGGLTVASEFLSYNSSYSSGLDSTVTTQTTWAFSGAGFAFNADTTTSTGGSVANPAVSTDGLTLNPLTSLPPTVLAGFYNTVSTFGTPTVNWTNQATTGSALQATGYAQVVYDYNIVQTTGTPEPVSILLLGAGLLVLSQVKRKASVRS
jgi:hypothetical protein